MKLYRVTLNLPSPRDDHKYEIKVESFDIVRETEDAIIHKSNFWYNSNRTLLKDKVGKIDTMSNNDVMDSTMSYYCYVTEFSELENTKDKLRRTVEQRLNLLRKSLYRKCRIMGVDFNVISLL